MKNLRVFLFAETDNAQQHYLLAKAMREYLNWDAMSMVAGETYLGYKTDWLYTNKNHYEEAEQFVKDTDLFIFQDITFDVLNIKKMAGHRNTIINGTGSRMRQNIDITRQEQLDGWAVVPMLCDTTLSTKICAPPFENWIVPIKTILELTKGIKKNDKTSFCHAPTRLGYKGTETWENAIQPLIDDGKIEYQRITGMCWEEAIKAKATSHIVLDSLGDTHYNAGNSLEGLVLEQTVVSNIDPWCYCLHTDLPMISTWGDKNIRGVIEIAIFRDKMMRQMGREKNLLDWVTHNFGAENQIFKWMNFIRWVMER